MGVAVRGAGHRWSAISVGKYFCINECPSGEYWPRYYTSIGSNRVPERRQSFRCARYGRQCMAVDQYIQRSTHRSSGGTGWFSIPASSDAKLLLPLNTDRLSTE